MAELACRDLAGVEVSRVELEREGPSVTADTLEALAAADRELFLLLGADAAANMATWRRLEETRPLATVVVVERAGERADPPGPGWRFEHVTIPRLDVSSSEIRRPGGRGRPIDGLTPPDGRAVHRPGAPLHSRLMARQGGSVVDEPAPTSRRERRAAGRGRSTRHRTAWGAAAGAPPGPTGRQAAPGPAEQRQFWFVLIPAVAVALALTVLVGLTIRSDDDGDGGTWDGGSRARRPRPDTILFGHRGGDGRLDLLVLAGTDRGQASILLLPTGTQVEVPSLGPLALADLPADADPNLLATTVENLLGVRVVRNVTLDDASLGAILTAAEPIPVELQRPAQFDDLSGGSSPPARTTSAGRTRPGCW